MEGGKSLCAGKGAGNSERTQDMQEGELMIHLPSSI